ncbi:hypothetical protein MLD38_005382 [Melastoma candidum]|uniref:Uncharacterized protein n=1 Tax=Melastoma candidum TaxID=119954 RepID=A0ACB9S9G9_9MYRT|nr:hypothetical protein MLD38_005382 [Melastoma candidum]
MRDKIAGIYRILKYSPWDSARERLQELPLKWDSYTVNQVLKSHPPLEEAWLFFNWASELSGFKHDQYTCTTMLDIFGEAGRILAMVGLFKRMQDMGLKADVVTYTSMMHWLSCSGDIDEAVRIWDEIKGNGFHPTVVSYTAYMKIMLDNGRLKEAADAYEEMLRFGLSPTCHTYTILMEFMVASAPRPYRPPGAKLGDEASPRLALAPRLEITALGIVAGFWLHSNLLFFMPLASMIMCYDNAIGIEGDVLKLLICLQKCKRLVCCLIKLHATFWSISVSRSTENVD